MAEYDVGPGHIGGDTAHVLLSRAQFIQRFNFNQGALLKHAADTVIILLRETVRQGGYPEVAIRGFHRQNLLHELFRCASAGRITFRERAEGSEKDEEAGYTVLTRMVK